MRTHLYKYLVIGLLAITMSSTTALAQNIDANRMNRDISIMENILSELFKTTVTASNSNRTFVISEGSFGRSRAIRGTYLSGYGIIFVVPGQDIMRPRMDVISEDGFIFYYDGDGDGGGEITEESIVDRISEFLKDYGSTIGQLQDDEHIMVLYGANSSSRSTITISGLRGRDATNDETSIPVVSVSATMKDLFDYRSGGLNENQLQDRLEVDIQEDKEYVDLKVMENIFETAFESSEEAGFRLSRRATHLMLDNFGVIYNFEMIYSGNPRDLYRAFNTSGTLARAMEEARLQGRWVQGRIESELSEEDLEALEEEEARQLEMLKTAYEEFKIEMAEYIVDYGRTLSSVSSDQFILASVNLNGRYEEIPERVDFQVNKSVLENYDRGRISRDEALEEVLITEY